MREQRNECGHARKSGECAPRVVESRAAPLGTIRMSKLGSDTDPVELRIPLRNQTVTRQLSVMDRILTGAILALICLALVALFVGWLPPGRGP